MFVPTKTKFRVLLFIQFILFFLLLAGCDVNKNSSSPQNKEDLSSDAQITFFSLPDTSGPVIASITAKDINITMPDDFDLNQPLKALFNASKGARVSIIDGSTETIEISGETINYFNKPIVYIVTAADGRTINKYTVTVMNNPAPSPAFIRVWSFNMQGWNANYNNRKPSDVEATYAAFVKTLKTNNIDSPDFIATQEAFGNTNDFITEMNLVPSQNYVQFGRARGGNNSPNETNAIIYDANKWKLINEMPSIASNLNLKYSNQSSDFYCDKYVDNNNLTCQLTTGADGYNRIVTYGIFTEKNSVSNRHYVIFTSTHNDTTKDSSPNSKQQVEQTQVGDVVNELIAQLKNSTQVKPSIVMAGDFNTANVDTLIQKVTNESQNTRITSLQQYTQEPDSILSNNNSLTATSNYHNYIPEYQANPSNVDSKIKFLTDHSPIAATVNLNQ